MDMDMVIDTLDDNDWQPGNAEQTLGNSSSSPAVEQSSEEGGRWWSQVTRGAVDGDNNQESHQLTKVYAGASSRPEVSAPDRQTRRGTQFGLMMRWTLLCSCPPASILKHCKLTDPHGHEHKAQESHCTKYYKYFID